MPVLDGRLGETGSLAFQAPSPRPNFQFRVEGSPKTLCLQLKGFRDCLALELQFKGFGDYLGL